MICVSRRSAVQAAAMLAGATALYLARFGERNMEMFADDGDDGGDEPPERRRR